MSSPVTGAAAGITVSTANKDLSYLFGTALGEAKLTLDWEGTDIESTQMSTSGVKMEQHTSGLRACKVNFEGFYPRASRPVGISSLITYASGSVLFAHDLDIGFEWPEEDITSFTGATGNYRKFMPGGIGSWGGSFKTLAVDDVNYGTAGLPTDSGSSGSAATFKLYEAGATDPALSGNIIITNVSHSINMQNKQVITNTFKGSGDLTQAGIGIFATSGTISRPNWTTGIGGTDDVSIIVQYASGRTFTGYAFWTSVRLQSQPNGLIRASGTLRFSGDITAA